MRLIVLSALVLPSLLAQALPDADVLIKEQAAAMKKHRSLQHVSETSMEMTGPMPMNVNGQISMAYQNPGKMRMEVSMQGMTMTVVSDGESTVGYNSMTKQYVKQAAALGPEGIAAMMVGTQNLPDMSKVVITRKTLREETIEMDGQKHDCWVVEQKVGKVDVPSAQGLVISDMVMTDWLDKKLGIDLQRIVSMKMQLPGGGDAMGMTQKVVKKSLKLDEPIPDSFFAFTPPADAKEVPTLMGASLPKGDLAGKDAGAFEVQSLDAKPYSLAGLKGKPVLLDFWATWCGPCRKSMPMVEKLYRDYSQCSPLMF